MEIKKQDVGVWVKASDEPKIGDYYLCKIDTKDDSITETIVEWGEFNNGGYKYFDWDFDGIQHFGGFKEDAEVIEWLKPISDVYVLTEDELLQFAKNVINDFENNSKIDKIGGMQ